MHDNENCALLVLTSNSFKNADNGSTVKKVAGAIFDKALIGQKHVQALINECYTHIEKVAEFLPEAKYSLLQTLINVLLQISLFCESVYDADEISQNRFKLKNDNFDLMASVDEI